jgi:hypothetical protein
VVSVVSGHKSFRDRQVAHVSSTSITSKKDSYLKSPIKDPQTAPKIPYRVRARCGIMNSFVDFVNHEYLRCFS